MKITLILLLPLTNYLFGQTYVFNSRPIEQEINCFSMFNVNDFGQNNVNAYLGAYLATLVYPERLGHDIGDTRHDTDRKEEQFTNSEFETEFKRRFSHMFCESPPRYPKIPQIQYLQDSITINNIKFKYFTCKLLASEDINGKSTNRTYFYDKKVVKIERPTIEFVRDMQRLDDCGQERDRNGAYPVRDPRRSDPLYNDPNRNSNGRHVKDQPKLEFADQRDCIITRFYGQSLRESTVMDSIRQKINIKIAMHLAICNRAIDIYESEVRNYNTNYDSWKVQRPILRFFYDTRSIRVNNVNLPRELVGAEIPQAKLDPECIAIATQNCIYYVFRGTDRIEGKTNEMTYAYGEWIGGDFSFLPTTSNHFRGKIHWGFWNNINLLREDLDNFNSTNNPSNSKPIWTIGHSLGAACAQTYAYYLGEKGFNNVHCYGYGSPPFIGDNIVARNVNIRGNVQRFEYRNDPITLLTPDLLRQSVVTGLLLGAGVPIAGISGGVSGGVIGATIGTFILPVFGTIVGGIIGGLVGSFLSAAGITLTLAEIAKLICDQLSSEINLFKSSGIRNLYSEDGFLFNTNLRTKEEVLNFESKNISFCMHQPNWYVRSAHLLLTSVQKNGLPLNLEVPNETGSEDWRVIYYPCK